MGQLILDLVPLAVGIILSPLAVMALVAVLLSQRARVNGVMFLIGWAVGITVVLAVSYGVLGLLKPEQRVSTPAWVAVVKVCLGLVLLGAGVWQYRKGHARVQAMASAATPDDVVAAAPQLPGWLKAASTFTASRSLLLGFGIFALNPVDLSCALIAGIDIRVAGLPGSAPIIILTVFGIIALTPVLVPVVLMLILGAQAEPVLRQARNWIAGHSSFLNAGLLLVVGALQLQKGLSALIG